MKTCALCDLRPPSVGLLCGDCLAPIDQNDGLCPEQIASRCRPGDDVWLLDRWGRPHPVADQTLVGRRADLDIHCASISRKHAVIERHHGAWTVLDLKSRNGTFVNGRRVKSATTLQSGDRVRFGAARFLFLERPLDEAQRASAEYGTQSLGPVTPPPTEEGAELSRGFQLIEPTRSEGGLLKVGDRDLRLTEMQFALVKTLARQRRDDAGQPPAVRGFVASSELMAGLSWATSTPDEINLRQLVRRLRVRLEPFGLTIEGRHGMGYRLRRA
jgi:pSer/pThr/pTyr-binding forkhead associated (FHA) protein